MARLKTGIDIVDIERLESVIAKHGKRFLERVYTNAELEETKGNVASLAARFAAKEAVGKALGTGIGPIAWREIEIRRGANREPLLYLHGSAQALAEELGLTTWSVSLSHTHSQATAVVVALGEDGE